MNINRMVLPNIPKQSNITFHLLALFVVAVWGTTFVSSKALLLEGLGPSDILLCRFILAYVCICLCSRPIRLFANKLKDEALCLSGGLMGGTLYFVTENTALEYTLVSNVALICSTTPLLTMLIQYLILKKSKLSRSVLIGSLAAFSGVGIVIFNGRLVLDLNPAGDLLCLASALSWTLYTFISKELSSRYSPLFVIRKTFFYGIVTLVPIWLYQDAQAFDISILRLPDIWTQLLFLGIIASFACFMLWNICLRKLNTIVLSNYIYLVPVISILTSELFLGEEANLITLVGTILVIAGMYFASKQTDK